METGGDAHDDRALDDSAAMGGSVASRLAVLDRAISDLGADALIPADADEAAQWLGDLEVAHRRLRAVMLGLVAEIDRAGLHRVDGHTSAKAMVRHICGVSSREAGRRVDAIRAVSDLPSVGDAFAAGEIGVEQVELLGRVAANPRVNPTMPEWEEAFVADATSLSFRRFSQQLRMWERVIDADGLDPDRCQKRRGAKMSNDHDGGWDLVARFGSTQGLAANEAVDRAVEAEWEADWAEARAIHGDQATAAHLARTDAQRRADALARLIAAGAAAEGVTPAGFTHLIVWSAETYEAMLRHVAGADVDLDPSTFRCTTIDGEAVDPVDAIANSLVNGFRRVVIDADGVVIDAGEKRFFTGVLRDLVRVASDGRCVWPGCEVPASRCETDHVVDHARRGPTSTRNGAPLCGFHNRWKQKGHRLTRGPGHTWSLGRGGTTPTSPDDDPP